MTHNPSPPKLNDLTEFGKKSRAIRPLSHATLMDVSISIQLSPAGVCSVERGINPRDGGTVEHWQKEIAKYYKSAFDIDIKTFVIPPPSEKDLQFLKQWDDLLIKAGVKNDN